MAMVDSSVARMPPMRIWRMDGGGGQRHKVLSWSLLLLLLFDVNYVTVIHRWWLLLFVLSLLSFFFINFIILNIIISLPPSVSYLRPSPILCLGQFIIYFRFFHTHSLHQFIDLIDSPQSSKTLPPLTWYAPGSNTPSALMWIWPSCHAPLEVPAFCLQISELSPSFFHRRIQIVSSESAPWGER